MAHRLLPLTTLAVQFDPWFNYRATQHLVKEGLYDFLNWFDGESLRRVSSLADARLLQSARGTRWAALSAARCTPV